MGDPSLLPDGHDIAKVGTGGTVGAVLVALLNRFFKRGDDSQKKETDAHLRVLHRLDAIQESLDALTLNVALSASDAKRAATDHMDLRAVVNRMDERMDKLAERLARLEGGIVE